MNKKKSDVDRAVSAASAILIFSDNSEKKLREKLSKKGFEGDIADRAVEAMREAGLINDSRLIRANYEYLANKKLFGRGRLKAELAKKGFDYSLIDEAVAKYEGDIDFKENCLKLVRRKGIGEKLIDKETRKNAAASLMRYGYGYNEIKYALISVIKENGNKETQNEKN